MSQISSSFLKKILYRGMLLFCTLSFIQVDACDKLLCGKSTSETSQKSDESISPHLYTLNTGDTIEDIAKKNSTTVDALWVLNSFTYSKRDDFLQAKVGQEIWLPASAKVASDNKPTPLQDNGYLQKGVGLLSSGTSAKSMASSYALSHINGTLNNGTQEWLAQWGTARTSLSLDDHGKLNDGSVDFLFPFYKAPGWILFSQTGWRHKDSRQTINLGGGARWFTDQHIYGINSFIDNDITGDNYRFGVGGEYWTPYIRFSANGYHRLTGWHQSRDFDNYDERPANGYDAIVNFILPSYPSLGMKLKFEQYYGNSVALFGRDNRQSNPYAGTIGLNWTPIPLVTVGTDWRRGDQGAHDTNFNLALNYRMGVPWKKQITPASVADMKSLAASRYDLVERNNNIILDYREQVQIRLALGGPISGTPGSVQHLQATVTAKNGLDHIQWNTSPEFTSNGGVITLDNTNNWLVTLPQYQATGNNVYTIQGIAIDRQGHRSNTAETKATVLPPQVSVTNSACSVDPDTLQADGSSPAVMTCLLNDDNNQPVSNMASLITVVVSQDSNGSQLAKGISQASTDTSAKVGSFTEDTQKPGSYTAPVTAGTKVGTETLKPTINKHVSLVGVKLTLTSTAQPVDAGNSGCQLKDSSMVADGSSTTTMTCQLKNAQDQVISGLASAIKVNVTPDDGSGNNTSIGNFVEKAGNAGTYIATVTAGKVDGDKILAPAVDDPVSGRTVNLTDVHLTLTPQLVSADDSACTLLTSTLTADGQSSTTMTCHIQDTHQHAIKGLAADIHITITPDDGANSPQVGHFTEQTDGSYQAPVTAGHATGDKTLTPDVTDPHAGNQTVTLSSVTLRLIDQAVSTSHSACRLHDPSLSADGYSTTIMSCEIKDDSDVVITGLQASAFTVGITPDGSVTRDNFSEDLSHPGTYTATVTAGTTPDSVTLSPSVSSVALSDVPLTLTTPVVDTTNSSCTVTPDSIQADSESISQMTCHLKDAGNHALTGMAANIALGIAPTNIVTQEGAFTETPSEPGTYTTTLTAGTIVDTATLSPSVKSGPAQTPVALTPVPLALTTPDAKYKLELTVDKTTPQPEGETHKYTFTAHVTNKKSGQNAEDVQITWAYNTNSASIHSYFLVTDPAIEHNEPTTVSTTDNNGKATLTLYSSSGGFEHITVTASVQDRAPVSADKTVEITASPIEISNVDLLSLTGEEISSIGVEPPQVPKDKVTFIWEYMHMRPHPKDITAAEGPQLDGAPLLPPTYSTDTPNVLKVGNAGAPTLTPWFVPADTHGTGDVTMKIRNDYQSGRYLLFETPLHIAYSVYGSRTISHLEITTMQDDRVPKCNVGDTDYDNVLRDDELKAPLKALQAVPHVDLSLSGLSYIPGLQSNYIDNVGLITGQDIHYPFPYIVQGYPVTGTGRQYLAYVALCKYVN
ncbi:inverse autotransporter beta domain-containing protein [Enterobacteriaceae bacterium LUAb1]